MANKNLFRSTSGKSIPATDTVNEAGGVAYKMSDEHALAQYACTGTFNGTFYATAETQLDKVLELSKKVSPEFLAKLAVYSRKEGLMKDMPALLLAVLSTCSVPLTKSVFFRVCDDAKMVKNFVQIIRSGQVGRKSLGTALKRLVQNWLASRSEEQLFRAVVGQDPSLADIIKMVHPKPTNLDRANFYKYLIGKELTEKEFNTLPENVQLYETFKKEGKGTEVPDVPFMLLTNLKLTTEQYRIVAENMSWSALRQNLNALARNGVFSDDKAGKEAAFFAATKLGSPELVRRAKAFPFQLFSAYKATEGNVNVPEIVRNALQDAMEASLANVPELQGKTIVAVDNSGSMSSPATGQRGTATSTISCLDAAAVMGSALLRRNPNDVTMLAFNTRVVQGSFNGRDSVLTNAEKLREHPGVGTDCSCVLRELNARGVTGINAVVYISDNESWVDSAPGYRSSRGTATMEQWNLFKKLNPNAKLVCIDIQPSGTVQANEREDILNVGGFSDTVFTVVDLFLRSNLTSSHWVGTINSIEI